MARSEQRVVALVASILGVAVPACDYPALPDIPVDNNEISKFEFVGPSPNSGLFGTASGTIVDNEISLTYFGPVDDLIASFTTNGTVSIDGMEQTSGVTAHNFSQPIDYSGVADDGETRNYRVVVTAVPAFDVSEVAVDAEFSSLVLADIDGDGRLDVVGDATVGGFSEFLVLLNRTPPGSRNLSFVLSKVTTSVLLGVRPIIVDLNQDGKPDIVTNGFFAINTTPTGSDSPSFSASSITLPGTPFSVTAADLDGDGKPDLVYTPDAGGVFIVENRTAAGATAAAFAPVVQIGPTPTSQFLCVADFDGDGRIDIVAGTQIFRNTTTATGAPTFDSGVGVAPILDLGAVGLFCGDFDGVGTPDIAGINLTLYNAQDTIGPFELVPIDAMSRLLNMEETSFGDLNGDGIVERIAPNQNDPGVLIGWTTENHAFSSVVLEPTRKVLATAVGDLDGDGKPDVVISNSSPSAISVLWGR